MTYDSLGAFLGLGLTSSRIRSCLRSLAVSLSLSDLSWRCLVAAATSSTLLGAPLAPFFLFIFSGLSTLDNDLATVEFFLVELSDSLFDLGDVFDGDEAVAGRACAALDDLNRQTAFAKRDREQPRMLRCHSREKNLSGWRLTCR